MKKFKHIHSSSRFDRSPESLQSAANKYNADADLVTYTEVDKEAREGALRRAGGDNWGLVSGDRNARNDCAIAFNSKIFRLIHQEQFKATDKTFFNAGGGRTKPGYATIAVLEHMATQKKIVVLVIHLPASVEGDLSRLRKTTRTVAWHSAFRNTRRRMGVVARNHKASAVLYVADFNVNFKKRWVRARFRVLAPSLRHTWKNLDVPGGTHHSRIIDGTLTRGALKVEGSARLYEDDSSSDHRPYIETLTF